MCALQKTSAQTFLNMRSERKKQLSQRPMRQVPPFLASQWRALGAAEQEAVWALHDCWAHSELPPIFEPSPRGDLAEHSAVGQTLQAVDVFSLYGCCTRHVFLQISAAALYSRNPW